jgi:hypothetical protein
MPLARVGGSVTSSAPLGLELLERPSAGPVDEGQQATALLEIGLEVGLEEAQCGAEPRAALLEPSASAFREGHLVGSAIRGVGDVFGVAAPVEGGQVTGHRGTADSEAVAQLARSERSASELAEDRVLRGSDPRLRERDPEELADALVEDEQVEDDVPVLVADLTAVLVVAHAAILAGGRSRGVTRR